jgi:dolichol-phosphate mannosyltransferase
VGLRTLVIIPTVNEAENLDDVVRGVRASVPAADVLVVDGASADGTPELAERLGQELGRVSVLRQTERNGIGGAYRAGFDRGLAEGYEVLVEMDADLSHDPTDLPRILAPMEDGTRLVIGSRYVPGGSTPDWPRRRRWLSRGANVYANAALGLRVRDATGGYRAFRASALQDIDYDTTLADGYAFQVELAYRIARSGRRIVEVPITFRDRTRGTSKMSPRIVVEGLWFVARSALRIRLLRRGAPLTRE